MAFRVLFVCTGNVCRSPLAERLLRASLDPSLPLAVTSAGTMGLTGHPIDGPSAMALRELAVDPAGHAARRLTAAEVQSADLVLTADSANRSVVVQASPAAYRRVFTMREFARLGAGLPPLSRPVADADLRNRVAEVAERRGDAHVPQPGADEIGDPFGADLAVARATAGRLAATVAGILVALGLPVPPGHVDPPVSRRA